MSGRADLLDLTTATKRNALTPEEREEFLSRKLVGRLATLREDGWPHVTPIWYVWEGGRFLLSLGNSRKHLANMRYGVMMARRGWLEASDILNTLPVERFARAIQAKS